MTSTSTSPSVGRGCSSAGGGVVDDHCALNLTGAFGREAVGATAFVRANGFEWALVFKAFTCDLATFRAVPERSWRGTEARLRARRPRGVRPMTYTLGVEREIQTIAIRCAVGHPEIHGSGACGNANFTVSLGAYTTGAFPFGASAAELTAGLEALPNVDHVRVVAQGDHANPAFFYGDVYTLHFWGIMAQASIPEVVVVVDGGEKGDNNNNKGYNETTAYVHTVQDGVALGDYVSTYRALDRKSVV